MYMKHVSTMSQLRETTMTYAGDVRDYENCDAAMRNIDPDCNLFNVSNTRYYLEDDINEIIKRNNLSKNDFSLMLLNIRSLPKNIGKLCDFLSLIDNKFTIGLSETWLHSDNVDLYEIPEYTSFHVTGPSKKGGGVSLYVHSSLEYTVLSEMSIITEYLECVFIEVNTRTMTQNKKIIVGIVYRPPSTNITTFTEHVMNIIYYIKVENKQVLYNGRFQHQFNQLW